MTGTVVDDAVQTEPFHIVMEENPQSPTMWVGICAEQDELADFLKKNQITDPYLVVVTNGPGGEKRYHAPLSRGVIHISFNRPGTFTVTIGVGWVENGGETWKLSHTLHSKGKWDSYERMIMSEAGGMQTSVYTRMGEGKREKSWTIRFFHHSSSRQVVVDSSNFAPEPAAWRKAWVGIFFGNKGYDQCNFRKRSLLGIPLAALLPLHYLMKLIGMLVCLILGLVYKNGFRHVLKPGRYGSLGMVFGDIPGRRSAWLYKGPSKHYETRDLRIGAGGVLLALLASVIYLNIAYSGFRTFSIWALLILSGCALTAGILYLMHRHRSKNSLIIEERKRDRREARRRDAMSDLERELETLSCRRDGQPMTVNRLLERKRTSPVIIFNRVKDGVCRPFAG
jgi:hypothetical protein